MTTFSVVRIGAMSLVGFWVMASFSPAQDVNEAAETAMKAAAKSAAPFVVKINTSGGQEVVGGGGRQPGVRFGVASTTGVIVSADGYIISSAYNFANKPTDITISIPNQPKLIAKIVATDTTRMLTLLKVEAKNLPVPTAIPKKEIAIGDWSLALGRALDPEVNRVPSISAGIISAKDRIWGKAVQTDAKISPVNYGGPLIGIDGRVIGILVPASPRGDSETAGAEWYDSGIGFAIPLVDVFAVLPRLKALPPGGELRRGLLGVTPQKPNEMYNVPVTIGTIAKASAAEKAGMKVGDEITKVNGEPVANFSALMRILGPLYEGDTVSLTVKRAGKEIEFPKLVLSGVVTAHITPFLGILPMRDDAEAGVEIRYVYPKSPAEKAGLKIGDRLLKFAPANVPALAPIANPSQLTTFLTRVSAETDVKLEVKRKEGGKTETLTVKLAALPLDLLADKTPLPSSYKKALAKPIVKGPVKGKEPKLEEKKEEKPNDNDKDEELETGLIKRTNQTLGREYWIYVPQNYDKNVSHGVMVWFHAAGRGGKDAEDLVKIWQTFCEDHHFILMGPRSKNNEGWVPSETEEILPDIREVVAEYTVDRSRVLTHGMGIGGQMAMYVGFHARDLFRGVAVSGSVLGTKPKDAIPSQPLSFFLVAGDKDPLLKEIIAGRAELLEKKFPVIYRQIAEFGKEYLDEKTFEELLHWMDSLDRI